MNRITYGKESRDRDVVGAVVAVSRCGKKALGRLQPQLCLRPSRFDRHHHHSLVDERKDKSATTLEQPSVKGTDESGESTPTAKSKSYRGGRGRWKLEEGGK